MLEQVLITIVIIGGVLVYNRFLAGRTFSLHLRLFVTWEALIALVFGVFSAIVVALLLAQGGM